MGTVRDGLRELLGNFLKAHRGLSRTVPIEVPYCAFANTGYACFALEPTTQTQIFLKILIYDALDGLSHARVAAS